MKLSIITPSYNQGQFIGQTFDSVLAQPHPDFEIEYIVMDAVSTDTTQAVIEAYRPKFAAAGINFIVVSEKDRGQADAINKGWKRATGDILTYLNSDDYYEPNTVPAIMTAFQQQPNVSWLYGWWNLVNKQGKVYLQVQPPCYKRQWLLDRDNIGQPSCFFRASQLAKYGYLKEELHLAMDYDLWLRFAVDSDPIIIPVTVSNMRYYADAKSAARTVDQLKEVYRLGAQYSKPFSYQRARQLFYYLAGRIVTALKIDISRRIDWK